MTRFFPGDRADRWGQVDEAIQYANSARAAEREAARQAADATDDYHGGLWPRSRPHSPVEFKNEAEGFKAGDCVFLASDDIVMTVVNLQIYNGKTSANVVYRDTNNIVHRDRFPIATLKKVPS